MYEYTVGVLGIINIIIELLLLQLSNVAYISKII